MAQQYKKLDPRIWDDETFLKFSAGQKLVCIYLFGSRQSNRCGIFGYSHGLAIEHLGINSDSYAKAFGYVTSKLSWKYDPDRRVLYIPTWWKYNAPENRKHLIGCLSDLHDVPQTELLKDFWNNDRWLPEHSLGEFRARKAAALDSYTHSYADRSAIPATTTATTATAVREPAGAGSSPTPAEAAGSTSSAATAGKRERKAPPPDDSPVVLTFPIDGAGPNGVYELRQRKVDEYAAAFVHLDVVAALNACRMWCIDNPTKRKTAKGMPARLSSWLNNATNRGEHRKDGANGAARRPLTGGGHAPRQRLNAEQRGEFPEPELRGKQLRPPQAGGGNGVDPRRPDDGAAGDAQRGAVA